MQVVNKSFGKEDMEVITGVNDHMGYRPPFADGLIPVDGLNITNPHTSSKRYKIYILALL